MPSLCLAPSCLCCYGDAYGLRCPQCGYTKSISYRSFGGVEFQHAWVVAKMQIERLVAKKNNQQIKTPRLTDTDMMLAKIRGQDKE